MFFFLAVQLAGCIQYIVQVTSREFAVVVVFVVFGYIESIPNPDFRMRSRASSISFTSSICSMICPEACGSMLGESTFNASIAL